MEPRISIVMPVRDAGRFLGPALDSVLCQTLAEFELIAVDDGSRDGSAERLDAAARADSRVRVVHGPAAGIVAALRAGLDVASGELVARMDADDVARPGRLAAQLAFLNAHPDVVAVGSAVEVIDRDGVRLGARPVETEHEAIDSRLMTGHGDAITHPTLVVRRSALDSVGGYRREFEWVEDFDLYLRLAEVGRLANVPDVLLEYRVHPGSVCSSRHATQLERGECALREAYARRGLRFDPQAVIVPPPPTSESIEGHPYGYGLLALEQGNRRAARRYARRALRRRPFSKRAWRLAFRVLLMK